MNDNYYRLFRKPNGYWYYWVYKDGKRYNRSTNEKSKTRAIEIIKERLDRGTILGKASSSMMFFKDYAEIFYVPGKCPIIGEYLKRGGSLTTQHIKQSRAFIVDKLIPDWGETRLKDFTKANITEWLLGLPARYEIGIPRANQTLFILKQILNEAVNENLLIRNPAADVKPLVGTNEGKDAFTEEQIAQIFSTPWKNSLAETACLLAAMTGMRLGEVQALTTDQIKNGYLQIDASYSPYDKRKTTKSGHSRIVPITDEMRQLLLDTAITDGYIFSLDGRKPMSRSNLTDALKDRLDELGITKGATGKKVSFHSFRHTFNSKLVASDIQGAQIRAVIGHESQTMTEHYTHLTAEDMKSVKAVQQRIYTIIRNKNEEKAGGNENV